MNIGPIDTILLVGGITETIKNAFGVSGKGAVAAALLVGFILHGLSYAMGQGLLPEGAVPWIETFTYALAGAISAMGYYDLVTKRLAKG